MTGIHSRGTAVGLCVLILLGSPSPMAAIASSPSTDPIGPSTTAPKASTSYSLKPTDFSVTISPTRLIIGQADIATKQEVRVINRGQMSASVTVQKRNFTSGTDGSLAYQDDAPYAASEWVTASPDQFDVAPGQVQVV